MDSQELFSENRAELDIMDCPQAIREVVNELRDVYGDKQVKLISWNETYIAVAFAVAVDLPTRGPVGDVDIRPVEPILLLLHKEGFPFFVPRVLSDRQDFPRNNLPHLNPVFAGQPASFCLHRGNIHDWFAEHTIFDLVRVTQNWLRDAASDRLVRGHDRFEPTLLDIENTIGFAVFDEQLFENYLNKKKQKNPGKAYLPCHLLSMEQQSVLGRDVWLTIRIGEPVPRQAALAHQEQMARHNGGNYDVPTIALLAWPAAKRIHKQHFGELPHDYDSLLAFAKSLGIPLKQELNRFLTQCAKKPPTMLFSNFLPVILAVRRPQPLIGSDCEIELLCFLICAVGKWSLSRDGWRADTPVCLLSHRMPLTPRSAQRISGNKSSDADKRLLLVGNGALGSKVGLHLSRSGLTNFTTVDKDTLAPHNLVRHGLLAESLGKNKAIALKDAVEAIFYENTQRVKVEALSGNLFDVLYGSTRTDLSKFCWIADCSASLSVLNMLADERLEVPVMRSELSNSGKLGILLVEGQNRNPRVDDLQIQLYDLAIDNEVLSSWLQSQHDRSSEIGSGLDEITIGLGCSSDTMQMADDEISYHASLAAISIKNRWLANSSRAGIQVSFLHENQSALGTAIFSEFAKVHVLPAVNASDWQIRLSDRAFARIRQQTISELPNETGGLLAGFIHHKRKIIYVTRVLDPPPDSEGYPYAFKLGVQDVPDKLMELYNRTGGLIYYVGEWHSHPNGSPQLSRTDKEAIAQIASHLNRVKIPTHILVATVGDCYAYVFDQ